MEQTINQQIVEDIAELTFSLLTKCHEKEERLASQFKITVPEFRCLRSFRDDQQLHMKALVERVGLSGSRLTRIIEGLEKKGFLTRRIDPDDRRGIIVKLTKKGLTFSGELESRYIEIHEEILEGVPEHIQEPLVRGLRNLLASLERWLVEK
jgi:DNA-binding MarR family transcriptional regulator